MDPPAAAVATDARGAAAAPLVYFRARARRQTTRSRRRSVERTKTDPSSGRGDDDGDGALKNSRRSGDDTPPSPSSLPSSSPVADLNVAATALRLRKQARQGRLRGNGLFFSSEHSLDARVDPNTGALGPLRGPDATGDMRGHITDRFTHQTGLVDDLHDRHMTEYIESRLYSGYADPRPAADNASSDHGDDDDDDDDNDDDDMNNEGVHTPKKPASFGVKTGDQPTKHGKLFEVAIPADICNLREDSKRRLAEKKKQPKPRSGRNRRGSDDMKRDQFVEQFLRENRLNVYEVPNRAPPAYASFHSGARDHRTADDRMADQFRRQYLDELARRRQRRRHTKPARQPPPPGDVLRGPKLGGSRNSRAAIRNILLQQEKEKVGRKV